MGARQPARDMVLTRFSVWKLVAVTGMKISAGHQSEQGHVLQVRGDTEATEVMVVTEMEAGTSGTQRSIAAITRWLENTSTTWSTTKLGERPRRRRATSCLTSATAAVSTKWRALTQMTCTASREGGWNHSAMTMTIMITRGLVTAMVMVMVRTPMVVKAVKKRAAVIMERKEAESLKLQASALVAQRRETRLLVEKKHRPANGPGSWSSTLEAMELEAVEELWSLIVGWSRLPIVWKARLLTRSLLSLESTQSHRTTMTTMISGRIWSWRRSSCTRTTTVQPPSTTSRCSSSRSLSTFRCTHQLACRS